MMMASDPPTLPADTLPAVPTAPAPPTWALPPSAPPVPARRVRTWPAALALLFVSPGIAELLSGSTPPLRFIQPFALITLLTLYGISALLIREIMVRRDLGWGNALLLGAAFGIFQEALIVQTWFNYQAPASPSHDMGTYGAAFGTSWAFALTVTSYHAVISITIPLILIGLLFPRQAPLQWLGRKGIIAMTIWLLGSMGLMAYVIAFRALATQGYHGPPPVPYLIAAGLTALAMLLGAFVRFPLPRPAASARRAPRLWTVRLTIFLLVTLELLGTSVVPRAMQLAALVGATAGVVLLALGVWRVRTWSARAGWGERHWLAVVTGVVLFLALVLAPLVEFGGHSPDEQGLVPVDLLVLAALLLFEQRLKSRAAARA